MTKRQYRRFAMKLKLEAIRLANKIVAPMVRGWIADHRENARFIDCIPLKC